MLRPVITPPVCSSPPPRVPNPDILHHAFPPPCGAPPPTAQPTPAQRARARPPTQERRYVEPGTVTSDIAFEAANEALKSSGIDGESLDLIIVAHNFGDVQRSGGHPDLVPSLAARVKAKLRIAKPRAAAYDLVFGCPGWIQGVITADAMIRAGDIQRALIIGADTLSRISDPHDRDSMIYADGAGATVLEARDTDSGILAHATRSDTLDHSTMLTMGPSYKDEVFLEGLFLKMEGRKLYKYALQTVAGSMQECLDKAGIPLRDVSKILIHQANEKMDEAIINALYGAANLTPPPDVMPMTISWLGNSSVATVPTLLDLIAKQQLDGYAFHSGEIVLFASVGAGMHINAFVYRMP